MKIILSILIFCSILLADRDGGPYIGLGYGLSEYNDDGVYSELKTSDSESMLFYGGAICTHVGINVCVGLYVPVRMNGCMHVCRCERIHDCMYVCEQLCMHAWMFMLVCMYACTYVCIYITVYIYIYISIMYLYMYIYIYMRVYI